MTSCRLLSALACCATAILVGQTGRDAYRQAYTVWQQAQANLERDAGTGGASQVAQADRSAAAATTFEATRTAYFKSATEEVAQRRKLLRTAAVRSSPDAIPPAVGDLASSELQTVTRAINKFATDKDPAIQQVRQSMERERVALAALIDTIQARQKTVAGISAAAADLEQARTKTAAAFDQQSSLLSQTVAQMEREGPAWSGYYERLAQAIQTVNAPAPEPAPPVAISTNIAPEAPRDESAGRIPLVRYVGEWTYPVTNGIFHGTPPVAMQLEVHENNGHAGGTLVGRFKPTAGVTDPVVQFTFDGDFSATPTQKFNLMTNDGTTGTIELIPGPAFNLLEVNFQTGLRPNKIRNGNFILVKK